MLIFIFIINFILIIISILFLFYFDFDFKCITKYLYKTVYYKQLKIKCLDKRMFCEAWRPLRHWCTSNLNRIIALYLKIELNKFFNKFSIHSKCDLNFIFSFWRTVTFWVDGSNRKVAQLDETLYLTYIFEGGPGVFNFTFSFRRSCTFWADGLTAKFLSSMRPLIWYTYWVWSRDCLQLHFQFLTEWYIFSWRFQQQSSSARWDLLFDLHIGGGQGGVFNFTFSNSGQGGIKKLISDSDWGAQITSGTIEKSQKFCY